MTPFIASLLAAAYMGLVFIITGWAGKRGREREAHGG
jgi:hypothetical protein